MKNMWVPVKNFEDTHSVNIDGRVAASTIRQSALTHWKACGYNWIFLDKELS